MPHSTNTMITEFGLMAIEGSERQREAETLLFEMLSQVEGFIKIYCGALLDDEKLAYFAIEWESLDHHQRFGQSDYFKIFVDRIKGVCEPRMIVHVKWEPATNVENALHAPMTEFVVSTLKSGADRKKYEAILQSLHKGSTTSAHGVTVEDPDKYIFLCGVKSIEDHKSGLESEAGKEILKQMNDLVNLEMKLARMQLISA